MTKREKVLQALEICTQRATKDNPTCSICPYKDANDFTLSCREMMQDILEVLKKEVREIPE